MKGICFKEPLFHATLEGQKTQTRRIVKTERLFADGTRAHEYDDGSWGFFNAEDYLLERNKPRYKVGEKVYLKEPYKIEMVNGRYMVFFSYSGVAIELPKEVSSEGVLKAQKNMRKSRTGYCNKMFTVVGLPEHFPHFIEITAVRCERLQDISDEDCFREGIIESDQRGVFFSDVVQYGGARAGICKIFNTPQQAYAALINKISGKGTWESNPFVFVYDYKLVK